MCSHYPGVFLMNFLLPIVLIGYAICVAQAVFALSTKRAVLVRTAYIALGIAFVAHTVWLFQRGIATNRCPLVGTRETSVFLSWCLVVAYLIAQRWYRAGALKAFIFPLIFLLSAIAAIAPNTPDSPEGIGQPLQRFLLPVHAGLIMLAYAAFFISFGAGVMYIIQERELKHKRFGTVFYRLPSLDTCDSISFKSMAIGLALLTLGVAAGMAWSRARDGVFWHNYPIEIFSVFTLIIYLIIIQSRRSAGWGGRNAALASIIGFVLIIASLAGLRYLDTLHVIGLAFGR
jgi:ABC-type transport system involved in cytochrome c biogenesis permease subunit